MTSPLVRDLRKLIDKETRVDVTIIDKSPIPSSRGVGEFARDLINRQDLETTYQLIDIIDGTNGPVLREDSNTEDPYNHVARIEGMTDPDDGTLYIILKPNGLFD